MSCGKCLTWDPARTVRIGANPVCVGASGTPRELGLAHGQHVLMWIRQLLTSFGEKLIRQPRPARRHEIDGLDCAQRDDVVMLAAVSHDADGFDGQELRERLADGVVEPLCAG